MINVNQSQDDDAGQQLERYTARLGYLVKVPSARIGEFIDSSALELEQQLAVIDDVDGRLEAILHAVRSSPEQGLEAFRRLDLRIISRDHGWREILGEEQLRAREGLPFLEVALEKYIEYLHFRRRLLDFILQRRAVMQTEGEVAAAAEARPVTSTPQDSSKRETTAFDRPARGLSGMASDVYRRLPPQEACRLDIAEDAVITVVLAGHRLSIARAEEALVLTDENGTRYQLSPGTHSLGRSRRCDVMLDPALREVSRKHLIIEWDGMDGLVLVDLSQLGTFLPRDAAG